MKNKEFILSNIKDIFDNALKNVPHESYYVYNGSKLRINGIYDSELYIWVGLMFIDSRVRVIIENIVLDECDRNKGIFTSLINSLRKYKYTENIIIQNVLTDEMHFVCKKLGLFYNQELNSYYAKM